jgi:hypothetical protein
MAWRRPMAASWAVKVAQGWPGRARGGCACTRRRAGSSRRASMRTAPPRRRPGVATPPCAGAARRTGRGLGAPRRLSCRRGHRRGLRPLDAFGASDVYQAIGCRISSPTGGPSPSCRSRTPPKPWVRVPDRRRVGTRPACRFHGDHSKSSRAARWPRYGQRPLINSVWSFMHLCVIVPRVIYTPGTVGGMSANTVALVSAVGCLTGGGFAAGGNP